MSDDPVMRAIDESRLVAPDNDAAATDRDAHGETPSAIGVLSDETRAIVAECAALDPSDTDNGLRLIKHRGKDMAVLMEIGGKITESTWLTWTGTHWDGRDPKRALVMAQSIGGLIGAEADYLPLLPDERNFILYELPHLNEELENIRILMRELAMEKAEAGGPKPRMDSGVTQGDAIAGDNVVPLAPLRAARDAKILRAEIDQELAELKRRAKEIGAAVLAGNAILEDDWPKRKARRRAFGVTSKNAGRIGAMLQMAAPHLVTDPAVWDAQQRTTYVANGVLKFHRVENPESDPRQPTYLPGRVEFIEKGWAREDRVTMVVPHAYKPKAQCPKFMTFIERFLPDADVREAVQIYSGLGLTGIPIQMLFFHYGHGANGKSVFMEIITRVLGDLAQSLPPSSIVGSDGGNAGGASPDIAMLFGKRMVRIAEVPQGEELREALVKALTGGEDMIARTLFKGYFSFQPQFKAHMSGNTYPRITGSDAGIWRRMGVVPWTVTIPEDERRDFESVVSEMMQEAEGILAWLVRGVQKFDQQGLVIPAAMKDAAAAYREEMDPFTSFVDQCVVRDDGSEPVRAFDLFLAYQSWSLAGGRKPMHINTFGRKAGQMFAKGNDARGAYYRGIRLENVPAAPEGSRDDSPPAHTRNPRDE